MRSFNHLVSRGKYLFPVAIVAAVALGGVPEIIAEGGARGGLDEIAMLAIAAVGCACYWRRRYIGSLVPFGILGLSIVAKVGAILIEDVDDRGDDFGVVARLVAALIIATAVHAWNRRGQVGG